jgi:hypothetical protein
VSDATELSYGFDQPPVGKIVQKGMYSSKSHPPSRERLAFARIQVPRLHCTNINDHSRTLIKGRLEIYQVFGPWACTHVKRYVTRTSSPISLVPFALEHLKMCVIAFGQHHLN